jgi:hypothetical protein
MLSQLACSASSSFTDNVAAAAHLQLGLLNRSIQPVTELQFSGTHSKSLAAHMIAESGLKNLAQIPAKVPF